jgi:hypothetical protein
MYRGIVFVLISCFVYWGCSEKGAADKYYSSQEKDSLLVNMITYMDAYAPGATNSTRFDNRFRPYYEKKLAQYSIEKYQIAPDSTHYFFVIRPVGRGQLFQRGVGGRFKLKEGSLKPVDFEEMWCTPHMKEVEVIKERGNYLFTEMAEKGSVDHLLSMKHYIEWPDSMLVYSKERNEWVATAKAKNQ